MLVRDDATRSALNFFLNLPSRGSWLGEAVLGRATSLHHDIVGLLAIKDDWEEVDLPLRLSLCLLQYPACCGSAFDLASLYASSLCMMGHSSRLWSQHCKHVSGASCCQGRRNGVACDMEVEFMCMGS